MFNRKAQRFTEYSFMDLTHALQEIKNDELEVQGRINSMVKNIVKLLSEEHPKYKERPYSYILTPPNLVLSFGYLSTEGFVREKGGNVSIPLEYLDKPEKELRAYLSTLPLSIIRLTPPLISSLENSFGESKVLPERNYYRRVRDSYVFPPIPASSPEERGWEVSANDYSFLTTMGEARKCKMQASIFLTEIGGLGVVTEILQEGFSFLTKATIVQKVTHLDTISDLEDHAPTSWEPLRLPPEIVEKLEEDIDGVLQKIEALPLLA